MKSRLTAGVLENNKDKKKKKTLSEIIDFIPFSIDSWREKNSNPLWKKICGKNDSNA